MNYFVCSNWRLKAISKRAEELAICLQQTFAEHLLCSSRLCEVQRQKQTLLRPVMVVKTVIEVGVKARVPLERQIKQLVDDLT